MDAIRIQRRLKRLERRVGRLEARFGYETDAENDLATNSTEKEPAVTEVVVPVARAVSVPPPIPANAPMTEPRLRALEPLSKPRPIHYAIPRAPHAAPRGPLEQTIGLKWAGWIGAIVLVIGAGLGIKFAVDNGWLGALPPAIRLGLMYLGGFALIGAGEWVYRRVNDIASAGVFGAGVATLFLVSYAGHGLYELYARDTAFVLMALSTLIGAAVAIRGRLVSVGTLSIIGGNLAPLVLHGEQSHVASFLCYLLMLQVVALVLAWWGGSRKWWMLRALSLATTCLWMTAIIAHPSAPTTPFIFLFIYAALYQLEVILSSARSVKAPLDHTEPSQQPGVLFSMIVTAALTAGMLWLLRGETSVIRGMWTLIFAAVACAAGFALPRRRFTSLNALSIGYRIQAATLLVVAVPVLFDGAGVVVGWATLACGFAILGATLDLEISRRASAGTWFLSVAYLVRWIVSSTDHAAHETWITWLHTPIPAYFLIGVGIVCAGQLVAILLRTRQRRDGDIDRLRQLALITCAGASVLLIALSIAALPTLGATLAIVVYAWLLFAGDLVRPDAGLVQQSAAVLVLVTVKWVVLDNLADRIAPGWSAARYTPILNPIMGIGVLIALSLAVIAWIRRQRLIRFLQRDPEERDRQKILPLVVSSVGVMLAIGLSFEIDRIVEQVRLTTTLAWPAQQAKQLAWTMLWTVTSVGLIGLWRFGGSSVIPRQELLRRLAILPMVLAIKFLVIDTLAFRFDAQPAGVMVLANFQVLAALFVIGGLAPAWRISTPNAGEPASHRRAAIGFLVLFVMLWTGTFEIDRWAAHQSFGVPWFVRQVSFSMFWSGFAVACVAGGFRARVAALRYFGLGLLAITLAKVVLIDLGHVPTGYRVLSFMGLGVLLLGTSVLYGKLTPRLLAIDREPGSAA